MTTDPRHAWAYRLRYWNARRGTAFLRACERLVGGSVGISTQSRPLAIRPPDRLARTVESLRLRHPAEVLRFAEQPGIPPWLPRDDAVPAAWCYSLIEPSIAPDSGAVWLRDGEPLTEVMGGGGRYSQSQDVRGLARRRPRSRVDGTWAVLPSHTYYHFLIEDLPALLSSLSFARDVVGVEAGVIAPRERHGYVSDLLATLPNRVHESPATKIVVERLVATGYLSSHAHPSSLALVRSHFGAKDSPGSRWIYVSRVGFRRSWTDEELLIARLTAAFPRMEVVEPHRLSLPEQAQLFGEAEVVVGTHGAGLANIVFAPPSAKVVEIATPENSADHFWRIASARGMEYEMVQAMTSGPGAVSATAAAVIEVLQP